MDLGINILKKLALQVAAPNFVEEITVFYALKTNKIAISRIMPKDYQEGRICLFRM